MCKVSALNRFVWLRTEHLKIAIFDNYLKIAHGLGVDYT